MIPPFRRSSAQRRSRYCAAGCHWARGGGCTHPAPATDLDGSGATVEEWRQLQGLGASDVGAIGTLNQPQVGCPGYRRGGAYAAD